MKTFPFCLEIAFIAVVLGLTSCGGIGTSNQRAILDAAGFRKVIPTTPRQKEWYAGAEPYKVQRRGQGGNVFYVYKDEQQRLAYVGGESEFRVYQRLAARQDYVNQNLLVMQRYRW